MAFALVVHIEKAGAGTTTTTTTDINTSGANLLIAAWSSYGGGEPSTISSDSLGNTWTVLSGIAGPSLTELHLAYCKNPIVGAGHHIVVTGTLTNYCSVFFSAWSGADTTTPYNSDIVHGSATATSVQPTSLTPPSNNCLVVTVESDIDSSTAPTVNSPLTGLDTQVYLPGNSIGGGIGYEIQTTAAARNPTWSGTSSVERVALIASFKAGAASIAALLDYHRNHH